MDKLIPLFRVHVPARADAMILETLHSGQLTQGKKVAEFERKLGIILGNPLVLTVNSCTSAIQLALRLAGVGPGDTVISTAMTCSASNLPVLAQGAKIIWADIDPATGLIDPDDVKRKITNTTKAVICVDWGGTPCYLNRLMDVCNQAGVKLIEDAAHAFGALYQNRPVGNFAHFTTFSYQAIKHLTTGDGGALICRDTEDYRRGKLIRWYGLDREAPAEKGDFRAEQDIVEFGYKWHMNDIAATLGLAQIPSLRSILLAHGDHARFYGGALDKYFKPVYAQDHRRKEGVVPAWWLYTVLLPTKQERDDFIPFMVKNNAQVSKVHSRNDVMTCFAESRTELPGVDYFNDRQVSIPVHWALQQDELEYIAKTANEFVQGSR